MWLLTWISQLLFTNESLCIETWICYQIFVVELPSASDIDSDRSHRPFSLPFSSSDSVRLPIKFSYHVPTNPTPSNCLISRAQITGVFHTTRHFHSSDFYRLSYTTPY
ncbi:hypothetical protein Hanom_Chr11g01005911 [Helianthus anomalus]